MREAAKRLLTFEEARQLLRVCPRTLRNFVRFGFLPVVEVDGERMLSQRRVASVLALTRGERLPCLARP